MTVSASDDGWLGSLRIFSAAPDPTQVSCEAETSWPKGSRETEEKELSCLRLSRRAWAVPVEEGSGSVTLRSAAPTREGSGSVTLRLATTAG